MNEKEADEMIGKIIAQLHEHFEAVQILVSWNEDGESKSFKAGAGSWYARIGLAREMLIWDKAHIQAREIKDQLRAKDDEGTSD